MALADATSEDEWCVYYLYKFFPMTDFYSFTVFTLGQIIVLPPAFLARRLAAMLMVQGLWAPIALGLISLLLALTIIWSMPFEVLPTPSVDTHQPEGLDSHDRAKSDDGHVTEDSTLFRTIIQRNKKSFEVLCLSKSIFFLTCTFLVTSTFGQLMAGTVFLQYVEKQLGVDMADVRDQILIFTCCKRALTSKGLQSSIQQRLDEYDVPHNHISCLRKTKLRYSRALRTLVRK